MLRRLLSGCVAAFNLAGTATAIPPPPIIPHAYYGPLRVCTDRFAFDVAAGESYEVEGGSYMLHFPGGGLTVESWIYSGMDMSDIVRPLGFADLESGPQLQRIRLFSRNAPGSEIVYLYHTGVRSMFPILSIRSNRFDGSENDLVLLRRLVLDEDIRKHCADVPQSLQLTAERENLDAGWLDTREHRGPLTVCLAGLAFDVGPGELLVLPWTAKSWPRFRMIQGEGRHVDFDFLLWKPLTAAPTGPLADDSAFALTEGRVGINWTGFTPDRADGPQHMLLIQRDPTGARALPVMPHAVFSFDPEIGADERMAIVRRLRAQKAGETCIPTDAGPTG